MPADFEEYEKVILFPWGNNCSSYLHQRAALWSGIRILRDIKDTVVSSGKHTVTVTVTWPPAADKAPAAWSEWVQIVACISCWVQSDVPLLTGYQCLTEASPSPNINMDKWHLDSSTLAWDQRHLIVRTGQRRTPIFNLDFERHVHPGESCYRQCTAGVHNPRTGDHSRSVGHLVQGHSENKCTSVFT